MKEIEKNIIIAKMRKVGIIIPTEKLTLGNYWFVYLTEDALGEAAKIIREEEEDINMILKSAAIYALVKKMDKNSPLSVEDLKEKVDSIKFPLQAEGITKMAIFWKDTINSTEYKKLYLYIMSRFRSLKCCNLTNVSTLRSYVGRTCSSFKNPYENTVSTVVTSIGEFRIYRTSLAAE